MKKICAVSGKEFEITPEDLAFYEKIGVPAPTLCPEERMRRRLVYRNEWSLYHRTCDATGKKIISLYSSDKPFPVYENDFWWSDKWDAKKFGRDFDFSRPFLDQFTELFNQVPKMARIQQGENENSRFVNCASWNKNCYLISAANKNEDCLYGNFINECRTCMDNLGILQCELAYQCVDSANSYDIQFCQKVHHSSTMRHCYDCRNCMNCFACVGLRNARDYHILNQKVSKTEFEEVMKNPHKKKEILAKLKKLYLEIPRLYTDFLNCEKFSGCYLHNCKNAHSCWDSFELEDCAYCDFLEYAKNCYDICHYGCTGTNELLYECEAVGHGVFNVKFSKLVWGGSSDVEYSYECFASQHLFGCAGLKKESYCIFNKKYSPEEYFALREKIIAHMKKSPLNPPFAKGGEMKYGEFFPIEFCPFGYNEGKANEYLPLSREEVLKRGWKWKDEENGAKYEGPRVQVPESIEDTEDEILDQILECEHCKRNYRVVKFELDLSRKMDVPIARECPKCRHVARLKLRNPRALWSRKCDKCSADIETTFAPTRPEKVYCEKCYLECVN